MAFCDLHYFSKALQKQTAAYVLLPDVGAAPYPVLYLLHGLSDDHTMWLRRTSLERYVQNQGLIVVMPDGGRGFYSDAVDGGPRYLDAIGTELVEQVDRTFPTLATREGRCLAGLSMGGYGAAKIALSFPGRFASAVSLSGAVGWGHSQQNWDDSPHSPEFRRILGDAPVGGPNDLFALAEKATASRDTQPLPALRVDCGTEDFLIGDNRAFHAHLDRIGFPHKYAEYPGAHDWNYWDTHIQDALKFHKDALKF